MGTLYLTKETRIYNRAKVTSSISDAGKTGLLTYKTTNLEHFLTKYTEINSK